MFSQARLKLTGWYLLISLVISLFFSGLIYRAANIELDRFVESQRSLFEQRWELPPILIDEDLINETRRRFIWRLVILNLGIIGITGVAGYYLSGKVLYPIKVMVNEQKRFISDASHELRTPLTAIKTNLEVTIRDPKLSPEAKNALTVELEQIEKLRRLSEDLLALSASKVTRKELVNIDEVVTKVSSALMPLAKKRHIAILYKSGNYSLKTDPVGLERVLTALIDNAVKYNRVGGKIIISTTSKHNRLIIRIKDTGIGISQDDSVHVYERFYRADKSRSSEGYGLGLAIVDQTVKQLGGEVELESKKGKGTTAIVSLPKTTNI